MLGQAIAALQPFPKRLVRQVWGIADIHTRQKWRILWPTLRQLPSRLRVLDAGCGTGRWSLELAKRFPAWTITGIDIDEKAIATARSDADRLNLTNVQFAAADFLAYDIANPYDVVLSVLSAHYFTQPDQQYALFAKFRSWLRSGGRLLLLGPRSKPETPFVSWLTQPDWHDVFTPAQFQQLAHASQMKIRSITAQVGANGTIAKQLDLAAQRLGILGRASYPLQLMLDAADRNNLRIDGKSLMLFLIAEAV